MLIVFLTNVENVVEYWVVVVVDLLVLNVVVVDLVVVLLVLKVVVVLNVVTVLVL